MQATDQSSTLLAGGDIHKLPAKERIDAYERVLKEKLYVRSADIVKKGPCGRRRLQCNHCPLRLHTLTHRVNKGH